MARRWQEHLETGRRLDEIDLCRLALASVPPGGLYDHLVCDEAQDLAEIQMVLLRLVPGRSLGGLFLAGDPQQVINPSGFRWAEVRSRIRDRFIERGRPAPELVTLTRNFRSVRGLIEPPMKSSPSSANGRAGARATRRSRARWRGPRPSWSRVTRTRSPTPSVASDRAARWWRDRRLSGAPETALGTTRVFTVPEAKGLEFDVAILWGVVWPTPSPGAGS